MGQLTVDLSAKMELLTKTEKTEQKTRTGISFPRYFTSRLEAGKTPYDEVQCETRTASIGNDKGNVIFEQRDIEVPVDWSQTATNIVASKYFYGKLQRSINTTSTSDACPLLITHINQIGNHDTAITNNDGST